MGQEAALQGFFFVCNLLYSTCCIRFGGFGQRDPAMTLLQPPANSQYTAKTGRKKGRKKMRQIPSPSQGLLNITNFGSIRNPKTASVNLSPPHLAVLPGLTLNFPSVLKPKPSLLLKIFVRFPISIFFPKTSSKDLYLFRPFSVFLE